MPETPSIPSSKSKMLALDLLKRSPSKLVSAFDRCDASGPKKKGDDMELTRSTEEKQALLRRHLNSVDDLVADLRESAPFGGVLA